ncbi:uncharacterized protein LOC131667272 isoform X2 [Phymastichus coffea]|uniref:uncharacterized protein LOC131667272 isoform X2 n=1 Tax=Phymastichus coffea TaxID=108790 RepID=UPI00273CED51|nr:uncharacterized protein LOC131667272 isoform X2 [Phymastichus coffea]
MEPSRLPRSPAPRLVFLFATLVLTCAATGLLCAAIMSDHWEEVDWDREALERANVSPVTWLLDGKVGRIEPTLGGGSSQQAKHHVVGDRSRAQPAFVVPMHGGIWTMCVSLTDEEIELLGRVGFPQERCINYLTPDEAHEEMRAAWQNRMQNLSISCSLVCLIILGAAVFVGFFGLCRHQISAVLVTGVMYLLAATFALFTLTIIHCKRSQDRANNRVILDGPEDGVVGGTVDRQLLKARRFVNSWSMDFGWSGVTLSALASLAWILLSKIMRFSPISAMIA